MIRQAVSKDIKPLAKLVKGYADEIDLPYEKNIVTETIRGGIARENACVFISKDKKVINGFAMGNVMCNGLNNTYELIVSALYVDSSVDKARVTDALLREVKKWGTMRSVFNCRVTLFANQDYNLGEHQHATYSI